MATMSAKERMVKARVSLIISQRFFGALAYRLTLQEDPTCDTMWTDGITLGFNPEWTDKLPMDELKGVICHEVMHCSLGHNVRRGDRDHEDWNIAADYSTDPIIIAAGMRLPEGGHITSEFGKDPSAEAVYSKIHGKKKQQDPNGKPEQQNQQKNGQNPDPNGQPGQGEGKGKGKGKAQGTGQNGQGDPGGCGEVRDLPGKDGQTATDAAKQQHQQEWQIATAQAANTAKGCGQLPGGLEELIKEMLEPKVPWQEVLQRFVEQVSRNDYTYTRTNPRYAAMGMILPTLYNKELPPIDIWVDTSGSLSQKDLQQFVGEINDIRSHYRTTIRIICCDTQVNNVLIVEPDEFFAELKLQGRGGTAFSPAIKWSMDNEEPPVCGVYLTDMDCNDFGPEPDFPVLWIQVEGKKKEAPFGEVIHMNPKMF